MTTETEALILSVDAYRENDGLVSALLPDRKIRFLARGIQKNSSKNRMICQPYSKVNISINERPGKLPMLLYGQVISYAYRIMSDLEMQCVAAGMTECISHMETDPTVYHSLDHMWQAFQKEADNRYGYACLAMAKLLIKNGIAPYTDGCVCCQRTDHLDAFSVREGGFLCQADNRNPVNRRPKADLIKIHSLFHCRGKEEKLLELFHFTLSDWLEWAYWFEYYTQIHLNSVELLKKIQ